MTLDDSLVRSLSEFEPPLFVFGGVAEDALFHGRPRWPHSDIDAFIYRDEVDLRLAQFAQLGYTDFDVWYEPRPGLPAVFHATGPGLDLESTVLDRDAAGAHFVMEDLTGRLHRVYFPADTFDYPLLEADGLVYRLVSPLALFQVRAAVEALGSFGPPRPKDRAAQERLRRDYLADRDEVELAPRIMPL